MIDPRVYKWNNNSNAVKRYLPNTDRAWLLSNYMFILYLISLIDVRNCIIFYIEKEITAHDVSLKVEVLSE